MKNWLLTILCAVLCFAATTETYAQTGPPAPSSGAWVIIDTNYTVGSSLLGQTKARITYKNNTSTLVTGLQFRVFYDKTAFTGATVAAVTSASNEVLSYQTDSVNGFITITLVYTGSSSTWTLAEGETFEITFTHAANTTFQALTAISNLTWSPTTGNSFPQLLAKQDGTDGTLSQHNYGGIFLRPSLNYHGTFTNVTGSGSKNIIVQLQQRPKTGGTWTTIKMDTTAVSGAFAFNDVVVDTTYFNARLYVKGDTLTVGNTISTADAAKVNQYVLGQATPTGFDYYAADVNSDNTISITDAYGIYGRLAGRFSAWPNNTMDVKFFTASQYATINGSTTNYTASIPGVTDITFDIVAGQPDSVTFYVLGKGDANGTGFHMARMVPIQIVNPNNAPNHIIDATTQYDNAATLETIEVNMPEITVEAGNLLNVPVKVLSSNVQVGSLQLALKYDPQLLEFKSIAATENISHWLSFVNPQDGTIEWGGADFTTTHPIADGQTAFNLQFLALVPKDQWNKSPLYVTRKYAGVNTTHKDLNITPTDGIIQVLIVNPGWGVGTIENNLMTVKLAPNPTQGHVAVTFNVLEDAMVNLTFRDQLGQPIKTLVNQFMPAGTYTYSTDLSHVQGGIYYAILTAGKKIASAKEIVSK
jgi:hypothetical protein